MPPSAAATNKVSFEIYNDVAYLNGISILPKK
jgi:hypothetical protein